MEVEPKNKNKSDKFGKRRTTLARNFKLFTFLLIQNSRNFFSFDN